ncbi:MULTISPECIES: DUF1302 domain-containing protein [unclassified Pseudomonas]|uniref:DUF1302 domain-containing protein n=1 Tax=unclassified Pseudomonas TaxID=196821 RepID=UPI00244B9E35|nr:MULTISPECIES: DUF1302 domain-containing protein [unclassified Pseudomonas]MDH0893255.1 DUF1302 domain-containing protein [Pseudomonas sp. GD03875]MDH1064239.1 DUF1302 domain-containing protein [Pseudomonas sp. GD03985]
MKNITPRAAFRLQALAAAVALGCAAGSQAATFNIGEIDGQFDSTLSIGASWSTRSADPDLIGANNGGDGLSQTSDDSRQNFKRGETFSKIFKGLHDLELKYRDTGVFLRGKYWYDFELKDEGRLFKDIDDSNRKAGSQSSGAQLLDAFLYHNYDIAGLPGSVRVGKQVVSWGESTFIMNGINAINPVDVSAFRRPGAELKEGLIPVNMLYLSQSLTDNLSAEAFYQLEWDQTVLDNCGTFFAQTDVVSDGCSNNLRALSPRSVLAAPLGGALLAALERNYGADVNEEGVLIRRGADRDARDDGQWGLTLRYLFEPLDTEFGAYFMNYHSRTPFMSLSMPDQATIDAIEAAFPATGPTGSLRAVAGASKAGYFMDYPEDIRLYGLSFATTLPTGTAWQGEISYRPNAPVQLNSTDILYSGLTPMLGFGNVSVLAGTPGQDTVGYRRKEITQFQTTFTHFIDQIMGASRLTLVGEVGVAHIGGLEGSDKARYGRDPVFGPGPLPGTLGNTAGALFPASAGNSTCVGLNKGTLNNGAGNGAGAENASKYCEDDGFATSTSWGYRVRAIWDYPNVFAGVNLKPSIAWSHDVKGYGPNGLFTEGAKAISLGLDAEYANTYSASLSYTDFFGGTYNTLVDRDFLALSVGVSF